LGFRRFFQPQQVGKSAGRSLPGFSLEQFSQLGREPLQNECNGEIYDPSCFNNDSQKKSDRRNITEFRKDVQKQLATQTESSDEKTERLVKTICGAIRQRADVILTAEPIRQKLGKRCMNARNYDDYSTPSRDEQIRQFIKQISR